jgi:hypothetical protein
MAHRVCKCGLWFLWARSVRQEVQQPAKKIVLWKSGWVNPWFKLCYTELFVCVIRLHLLTTNYLGYFRTSYHVCYPTLWKSELSLLSLVVTTTLVRPKKSWLHANFDVFLNIIPNQALASNIFYKGRILIYRNHYSLKTTKGELCALMIINY